MTSMLRCMLNSSTEKFRMTSIPVREDTNGNIGAMPSAINLYSGIIILKPIASIIAKKQFGALTQAFPISLIAIHNHMNLMGDKIIYN